MIVMRPIGEEDVISVLNNGRFCGELDGYVVMNGGEYLGYTLFKSENGVTTVLDTDLGDNQLIDGAVRACVASGERAGTELFEINMENQKLAEWCKVFCKNATAPYKNKIIFHECK